MSVSNLITSIVISFDDGSTCNVDSPSASFNLCGFGSGELRVTSDESALLIGLTLKASKQLSKYPVSLVLNQPKPSRVLALTFLGLAGPFIGKAFGYYNYVAQGKQPRSEPPPDKPEYPPGVKASGLVESDPLDCWSYPMLVNNYGELHPYTVMVLIDSGNGSYTALFTFSNNQLTAWLDKGLVIRTYTSKPSDEVKLSYVASIATGSDPYDAVAKAVSSASRVTVFKTRSRKAKPLFMNGLGWCSWNALLSDDLSHDNVVKIVKGLRDRGVPISWVIIDDGWQDLWNGVINSIEPSKVKFPRGFKAVVDELRNLGVSNIGLWFTINLYWNGASEAFIKALNAEGFKTSRGYVPKPNLEDSFKLYDAWFRVLKSNGFSFVKVDNQWSIHHLYRGFANDAEAAAAVELGLQLAATTNGLDVLNCMSMLPGNYSNYAISNALRVSIDYIPMWRTDAKLHTMWSAYNSLLYSNFGYPDYDMWISYDPSARLIAVSRIFSGGPVYITDREPEKTNVELIKWITLSNGEVIRVDEPALPTRDILFRDPYNETVLLKLASTVNGYPAIAFMNVNKNGVRISEEFKLVNMPMKLNGQYAYYKVISGDWGIVKPDDSIKVELSELEAEVVVLAPLINGKAALGIVEKALPPYAIKATPINGELMVEAREDGTMAYVKEGRMERIRVKAGERVRI
ncbi:Sip1-related alpha-galactosidase [Caldivirga maquilingensis]|uniref:Raffinose synthase n=1 Tax=Caldivirga maquilingensis (strain ATCC 700844 / DSM 13496 / JCM 10307 / IC-167) TaxID=397948 RepID=A8MDK0_CALMQ|nr:Sip1-related alpha-galactosidase [Caldivirga maquilingensis]ABW01856.1 raffinose synthase [Caldivirga maquilingensis IC-167]